MTPEDFIRDYTNGCSNELSVIKYTDGKEVIEYHEWVSPEVALGAVELAREEMITKACSWLKCYIISKQGYCGKNVIDGFRKYLEE